MIIAKRFDIARQGVACLMDCRTVLLLISAGIIIYGRTSCQQWPLWPHFLDATSPIHPDPWNLKQNAKLDLLVLMSFVPPEMDTQVDESSRPPQKRARDAKYAMPTMEEARLLRETEGKLFEGNLLRLEVEELLGEVRVDYGRKSVKATEVSTFVQLWILMSHELY